MDEGKKGSSSNHLSCDVCKIDFNSKADFALHEFSKKHCDNLIRLAKQKPVISKQKTKNEISPQVEKQPPKINSVIHTGSFAKYGYFVPGEIYLGSEISREFNTDYDPYLQKFAENPLKEKFSVQPQNEPSTFFSARSFNKKKKKKIKTCEVCNLNFLTLPEYEAHMKSPQHIWKLKVTGMGVSAHFVKASTDLHTTDINEEYSKTTADEQNETAINTATVEDTSSSEPFPLLYCSDCELLLNSPQQYNTHINGKLHIECAQRKAELKAKKEKLENPSPNQLYCFSCKISLNNLFQYNEHKNGKKHKTKCRTLIRKGITIPPEERVSGIPHLSTNKPIVYPELYEKLVLEKQKGKGSTSGEISHLVVVPNDERNILSNLGDLSQINSSSGSSCNYIESNVSIQQNSGFVKNAEKSTVKHDSLETQMASNSITTAEIGTDLGKEPKGNFGTELFKREETSLTSNTILQVPFTGYDEFRIPEAINSDINSFNCKKESGTDSEIKDAVLPKTDTDEEPKYQVNIVTDETSINCSICNESFHWQAQLDVHLGTEDHLKKILELKLSGKSENEILKAIFSDRNVIKPNVSGKFSCSICNVATDSIAEFDQHLSSIVHKYTEKDYKKKRALEVKYMVPCNESGQYFCKLCQEGWVSLMEYIQHLHCVKHKSVQRAQRANVVLAKRKNSYLQKQRLIQSMKKRNLYLRRVKTEKNPGVRTKVSGVVTNICTGAQAPVPNLEPLEHKIDIGKNVSIGICDNDLLNSSSNNNNNDKLIIAKKKKINQISRSNRRTPEAIAKYQSRDRCPFILSGGNIPPLMSRPSYPRHLRPNVIPHRNWTPFSSPQPPVFGPFCGSPSPLGNPYFRPQRFLRPPWPRHRFPFPHS